MGTEDMARQALNVFRMRLLGAEVRGVESGSRTLKDAINEAMRDWVTNVDDTYYLLGSVLGPHPYPLMVREFQSVIGKEAREQIPGARGPAAGRGRRVRRRRQQRHRHFRCVRRRSRRAADRRRSRRRANQPRPACGAVRGRQRGRAAGHAHLRAAGRARQHRADAFDFSRARLRRCRPGARLAAGARTRGIRVRDGRGSARRISGARAARRHPAGARVGACDRRMPEKSRRHWDRRKRFSSTCPAAATRT